MASIRQPTAPGIGAAVPPPPRRADRGVRHVYIVDDDASLRRSLSFSLRTAGFETRAFASGADFLDALDTIDPGCVLLDVRMPELDGPSVLRRIADQLGKFAIITMTGHGDIDTAVQVMKLGSVDFIEKPFADATLLEGLDAAFSVLAKQLKIHLERADGQARIASLTPRERDVLQSLVAGHTNKMIANRLKLSSRTVEMHRANLMYRLGAGSIAEAVRLAIVAGVMPPTPDR